MNESGATRVRWILIGWIFVLSAVGYLDRVNISIAGGAIMRDFHLSKVQFGVIQSFFVGAYALFQAPAGRLADRMGPRKILALAVIWWGAVYFFNHNRSSLCLGVRHDHCHPLRPGRWRSSHVSGGEQNRGGMDSLGRTWAGERFNFCRCWFRRGCDAAADRLYYGPLWLACVFLVQLFYRLGGGPDLVRAGPRHTRRTSLGGPARKLDLIEAGLPSPETATKARLSWGQIFSNKDVMIVTLSYFTYGYAAFIFFAWFYIYLSDVRGVDLKRSGWLTTLPFIAMAVGSLLGGWLSDTITKARGKRQGRCLLAAGAIGLAAVLIALGTRIADTNTAVLYLAAGAGALYLSQSSFWSVSADIGKKSAGSVSGVMNMGAQTGSAITATLTPYIGGHFGWNASFLVAAGLCACGAVAWLFVNPIESQSETMIVCNTTPQRISQERWRHRHYCAACPRRRSKMYR